MLIVDPLAELHTEQENDNTALRSVIANFRALAVTFNMAVIVLAARARVPLPQVIPTPRVAPPASSAPGAWRSPCAR